MFGKKTRAAKRAEQTVAQDGPLVVPATEAVATVPTINAGWYPTADGGHVRWHDGIDWTDHTQPLKQLAGQLQ